MRSLGIHFASAALFLFSSAAALAQEVTLTISDTMLAPKSQMGIGINGGGSWYNFVGAILVDDPSFEGPDGGNGFARHGWPWFTGGGSATGAIDTNDPVTGVQCQRVEVTSAPVHMSQGRDGLPQLPLIMTARPGSIFRIKLQIKSDMDGARVRLGVVGENWQGNYGPELSVSTGWQVIEWDYVPAQEHLMRGISVQFMDVASYWLDDLVAWDTTDLDPATGLSATYVARLKELKPDSLRMGGLGVNGIPLQTYLRDGWDLSYGPPALQPDFDLNTFLRLCREVGAIPFITVPPAFSDAASWQVGDLTDHVIANVYEDHGNLVDYLGGDANTAYGARREADGHSRWDQEFAVIYLELGNELWGTPDDSWDMDPNQNEDLLAQMLNFVTYNQTRMSEMRGRPGWRANMKVGFCGRSPTTWIGGWPGSYDGTVVPAIGALTDFSTIDLYYGGGAANDSDEVIFGTLFATAQQHEHEIADMKIAFSEANNGVDIETTVYEGNATWGGYENDLNDPSALYFKSVSQGAAVSLLDVYAASNRAGVTVNNHFHYAGNVWGATGPYPAVNRKPAFYALKLFDTEVAGDMVSCQVQGADTWDDAITGEQAIPTLACYPYLDGEVYSILIINRHRTQAREVRVTGPLAPLRATWLSHADINANNESGEVVNLQTDQLSGVLEDPITLNVPAHSAVVLVASKSGDVQPDAGVASDGDGGQADAGGEDAGSEDAGTEDAGIADAGSEDAGPQADVDLTNNKDEKVEGSCGCASRSTPSTTAASLFLFLGLGIWIRRRRH